MIHIKRINEMAGNNASAIRGEYRVYALEERTADAVMRKLNCKNVEGISDDMFIDTAETEGTVWSLAGFVENWNNNDQMIPSPDFSYIRIIAPDGKMVDLRDDTYKIYAINSDEELLRSHPELINGTVDDVPDDEFIRYAQKENGFVATLGVFQNGWNDGYECPSPDVSWIRIIKR